MRKIIGIDIGGTKIEVTCATESGEILEKIRFETSSFESPQQAYTELFPEMKRLFDDYSAEAIGIAAPGPVSIKKGVILYPPNLQSWRNVPIVEDIKQEFSQPVFFNQDANAGALAEQYFGAGKGKQHIVYITMSTGIGAGIILNGRLVEGASDMTGEIGHIILEKDGPLGPGKVPGCFEWYCGGVHVEKRVQKAYNDASLTMKDLVEKVRNNEQKALDLWEEMIGYLAQGLNIVLMLLNPEVISLGTIAVHAGDLLMEPLLDKLQPIVWKEAYESCVIAPTPLGEDLGSLGPIAIALDGLR